MIQEYANVHSACTPHPPAPCQPSADIDFAAVTDRKLVAECGGDCKSPFVVMHKKDEAESPQYTGNFDLVSLKAWTTKTSVPLVIRPRWEEGAAGVPALHPTANSSCSCEQA